VSLPAGRLRHRVTIEELMVSLQDGIEEASSSSALSDTDPDADGTQTETWTDAYGRLISAEISPLSGRELLAADAVQGKVNTRIRMRHRPGLRPSMRVLHRAVIYNVEAVVPDPESGVGWVTLLCSSGVNEG
jgi:SPP1 family predicted phage head-tail adaptor